MRTTICFLCVILINFPRVANAFCPQLTLQDLTQNSQHIVVAEVVNIDRSVFFKNNVHVYTSVRVKILQVFKGGLQKETVIELIMYGGILKDKEVFVLEAPSFKENEKVLLFLEERISKQFGTNYIVTGMNQGKFSFKDSLIYRDSDYSLLSEKGGITLLTTENKTVSFSNIINIIDKY